MLLEALNLDGDSHMAEKYCIFLRGVNVGGVKMKMDELKKAFAELPYGDVKTVLATGNVIIASDRDPAEMKPAIEAALSVWFGYDAVVFIRSATALKYALELSKSVGTPTVCHLYYLLCESSGVAAELDRVFRDLPHQEGESFIPLDTGAFWVVPIGETLTSAFGTKALGDRKFKDRLTSRNINTIEKIVHAMGNGETGVSA
jgi:uncharacterized protein (DUF1697 family)